LSDIGRGTGAAALMAAEGRRRPDLVAAPIAPVRLAAAAIGLRVTNGAVCAELAGDRRASDRVRGIQADRSCTITPIAAALNA
jgi:hypothetical protein